MKNHFEVEPFLVHLDTQNSNDPVLDELRKFLN